MSIYFVNPSDVSFGTAVIACRWLYVLAGATPRELGTPIIVDETIDQIEVERLGPGDLVGIGIHTLNARRGYEVGRAARARGAAVVFGGIHATLYPEESFERGGAHTVVSGDGDLVWPQMLADWQRGELQRTYIGGRVEADEFAAPRWDLLPTGQYMWGAVQTVRGCPKHCSFCSVWRTDGQRPRLVPARTVAREIVELRRKGINFILLSDDNFYPVTLQDIDVARRRSDPTLLNQLEAIRRERFELLELLSKLPDDLVLLTQITMEAAEDPEYLTAMRRAHIRGGLIGIETITDAGLSAIYKGFNSTGGQLVDRLRRFSEHGFHVLGSFIFGLPTDGPETFGATAELAQRANLAAAQFVLMTPFPGTVDFDRWEKTVHGETIDGIPVSRYWLLPPHRRPCLTPPNSLLSVEALREGLQRTWTQYYSLRMVWERSRRARKIWERVVFILASKLYRQMYARTGISADSARASRARGWARWIAKPCRRLFQAAPMPNLQVPS